MTGSSSAFPNPMSCSDNTSWLPAGVLAGRAGAITSAADSLQIRLFGRGAHGSMPQASIDPVVMAAATVLRLQTIVSREVAANEAAVVTIGALQAGTKENVIPDEAIIKLNVRTFDEGVRKRVLAAIERIVNAEAAASGAPKKPEITPLDRYSLVTNDPEATKRVGDAFRQHFPATVCRKPSQPRRAKTSDPLAPNGTRHPCSGSSAAPTPMSTRKRRRTGGSARSRPITTRVLHLIHPTLETGVEALVVAAQAWLCGIRLRWSSDRAV